MAGKKVRRSAVAGTWYPGTKEELTKTIRQYFDNIRKLELSGMIKAIIVPHAGYAYSGQTAATAFKQIEAGDFKTVIIIGPSHTTDFVGASLPDSDYFETPLGNIKVAEKCSELAKERYFSVDSVPHEGEHSLEIEMPFLQVALKDFEIIPIAIGASTNYGQLESIAKSIKKYLNDKTLIVISSDFTHYGRNYGYVPFRTDIKESLKKLDMKAVSIIAGKNANEFEEFLEKTGDTICGRQPITILLEVFRDEGSIKPVLLYYTTSGELTGDFNNSVSYAAMVFVEEKELLNKGEQEFLLKLARDTIAERLKTGKKPKVDESRLTPALKKVQGCFVTLSKNHELRGCIGHIFPREELYKAVMDNAISAAFEDNRFEAVELDELKDIKIEISVLTEPKRIEFSSPEELKGKLRPNVDGVVLKKGLNRATYLPQVWEQLPDKEEFLSSLCMKGGMSEGCWKNKGISVSTYQAFVFGECQ